MGFFSAVSLCWTSIWPASVCLVNPFPQDLCPFPLHFFLSCELLIFLFIFPGLVSKPFSPATIQVLSCNYLKILGHVEVHLHEVFPGSGLSFSLVFALISKGRTKTFVAIRFDDIVSFCSSSDVRHLLPRSSTK